MADAQDQLAAELLVKLSRDTRHLHGNGGSRVSITYAPTMAEAEVEQPGEPVFIPKRCSTFDWTPETDKILLMLAFQVNIAPQDHAHIVEVIRSRFGTAPTTSQVRDRVRDMQEANRQKMMRFGATPAATGQLVVKLDAYIGDDGNAKLQGTVKENGHDGDGREDDEDE